MASEIVLFFSAVALLVGVLFFNVGLKFERALERRLRDNFGMNVDDRGQKLIESAIEKIARFGNFILTKRFFSSKGTSSLHELIASAGFKPDQLVFLCVGSKFILLAVGFAGGMSLGYIFNISQVAVFCIAILLALIGSNVPEWTIKMLAHKYRRSIMLSIADMLDLMVVCAEAGLTLETLIERVSEEIIPSSPAISKELKKLSTDLKVAPDREAVLKSFGITPFIEPFQRLGTTLVQTVKYGSPLSEAIRLLSDELRTETIAKAEEIAGRMPALLTIPMILFIIPTIFIILFAPVVIRFF